MLWGDMLSGIAISQLRLSRGKSAPRPATGYEPNNEQVFARFLCESKHQQRGAAVAMAGLTDHRPFAAGPTFLFIVILPRAELHPDSVKWGEKQDMHDDDLSLGNSSLGEKRAGKAERMEGGIANEPGLERLRAAFERQEGLQMLCRSHAIMWRDARLWRVE